MKTDQTTDDKKQGGIRPGRPASQTVETLDCLIVEGRRADDRDKRQSDGYQHIQGIVSLSA
jgi:hypothetical protein